MTELPPTTLSRSLALPTKAPEYEIVEEGHWIPMTEEQLFDIFDPMIPKVPPELDFTVIPCMDGKHPILLPDTGLAPVLEEVAPSPIQNPLETGSDPGACSDCTSCNCVSAENYVE